MKHMRHNKTIDPVQRPLTIGRTSPINWPWRVLNLIISILHQLRDESCGHQVPPGGLDVKKFVENSTESSQSTRCRSSVDQDDDHLIFEEK